MKNSNVISFCDYKQRKIEEAIEREMEAESEYIAQMQVFDEWFKGALRAQEFLDRLEKELRAMEAAETDTITITITSTEEDE